MSDATNGSSHSLSEECWSSESVSVVSESSESPGMARALLRGGLVGLLGRPRALTDGARDRRQALLARRCGPLWRLHGLSQALSNAAI